MTRPCFRDKRKSPDERDKLTIDAIGAEIFSINTFSREVGSGSREQDLGGEINITVLTVSCVTRPNSENVQVDGTGREARDSCIVGDSIPDLRLLTFPEK